MGQMTEDELSALDDPWVDWFLERWSQLLGKQDADQLLHLAESYGRPGSMTEGGQRFARRSVEIDLTTTSLQLYLIGRKIITPDDLGMGIYDKPPPTTERIT